MRFLLSTKSAGKTCLLNSTRSKSEIGGIYTAFSNKNDLEALHGILQKNVKDMQITEYQEQYLVLEKGAEIFLLQDLQTEEELHRYAFFAPTGSFKTKPAKVCMFEQFEFYLPYHLLADIPVQPYNDEVSAYETGLTATLVGTFDEIYDFYAKRDGCSVERGENTCTVFGTWTDFSLRLDFSEDGNVLFTILEGKTPPS